MLYVRGGCLKERSLYSLWFWCRFDTRPHRLTSYQTSCLNVELRTTELGAGRSHDLGSLVNINDDPGAQ